MPTSPASFRLFSLRLLVGAALSGPAAGPVLAQVPPPPPTAPTPADTTHKFESPARAPAAVSKPWYRGKLVRASLVPAVLIGYGISTINGHGFYSSYEARHDLRRAFPNFHTRADDFLVFAPYLELGAVLLAGVEARDDRLNLGLVILKGEAFMLATAFTTKYIVRNERPDGSDDLSFPSGHTAQAFLAASIVHTEFRDKSQWYGIGAYALATGVGALRMLNDKHWQADVVAGAGFGILSAHLAYLSHRHRWGRQPLGRDVGFSPTWNPAGGAGLRLTWQPK
ncbi:phosphatase PAP2 family protein [uncultured Hymenobacter sp.]|uniref:phosphatase PAP2 family protein n=1 Tax=uncultured Hymenobacter sp. TaxID=170016 RepID=UPI0035CC783C